ncbi:MAG: enhanced serine sensitivity protein SseB [Clostridiales bacterium]|nr:enhanced serine sensitivity protein SseB [Clostridiales bacterium]
MSSNKPPLIKPKAVPNVGPVANKAAAGANQQQQPQQQITNPILCKAMEVFKADPSTNTQAAFIQQLFKSRLLIPCNALNKTEKEGKTEVQLQFLTLKNKNGDNLLGVFTDWDQIRKQQNNTPKEAAGLPFPEIVRIAVSQKGQIKGILINPFEHGLMIDEKTIDQMDANIKKAAEQLRARQAAGAPGTQPLTPAVSGDEGITVPGSAVPHTVTPKKSADDDILYIGEPLEEPYEITSKLKQYFRGEKSVTAAYFLEIYRSDHGKPSPLVVIDCKGDKDAKEVIYSEIREIYKETAENPEKELTIMTSGEKFAKDGIINKKPFYTRKVFGIF